MMLRRLLSPSALPGRRALFVLTAAVSLCAALAGFTAPAQAQSDTEVWSGIMKSSSGGTLPAGTVPSTWPQGEHAKGYWNLAGGSGGTISKNTFTEGSVTYTIKMLAGATNSNQVYLELDKALPAATRNAMTLHLSSSATTSADDSIVPAADDVALTLSTATLQNSDKRFYWPGDTFLGWYHNYHYRARLTKTGATSTNAAPAFSAAALAATTQSVAENTAADTDIGSAYTATDTDADDTLTYSLGGTDVASFAIDTSTGQLKTKAPLDFETKPSYAVTVKVSDGTASATIDVTVTVTDVNEPPLAPPKPTFGTATSDSLAVMWEAPADNSGRPDIKSYDLQYKLTTVNEFTPGPQGVTGKSATIDTGLTASTAYHVQVRATNDEGDGAWSASGEGSTSAAVAGDNKPSTGGTVTISGTRAVGKTLSASVSVTGIMDADGLPDGDNDGTAGEADDFTFTYQWIRVDGATGTDIAGATESRYLLVAADAGKTVKVRVGFTDGAGNAETLESGATGTIGDGKPGQLSSFIVSSVGDGKVSLFLGAPNPSNEGSSSLIRLEVRYKKAAGEAEFGDWLHHTGFGSPFPFTVTGLTNGVEYTFEGRAVNSQGVGPARTVKGTPVGLPEEITDLTATADVAAGQVVLRWTAPADSGSPITKYQYRQSYRDWAEGYGAWTDIAPADLTSGSGAESNVRSYTVARLTKPRNYNVPDACGERQRRRRRRGRSLGGHGAGYAPGLTLTPGDDASGGGRYCQARRSERRGQEHRTACDTGTRNRRLRASAHG